MKQICWLWGLVGVCAYASTWVVPEEIPTIQMALNISADGDTILVQPGVYSEALLAPNGLFFVMIGIFDTTKENDEWPIIDPSLLDSSDRKACLRLPSQTSAVIKNIWFRNRWPMFPRVDNAVGGIYNQCLDLTVKNCRFDSTYRSLSANSGVLLVEDCEFIHHVSTAIIKEQATFPAVIRNSSFTSNTAAIHTIGNTLVEECYFHETEATHWINAWGSGITFRACTFDAALSPVHGVIWVTGSGSGLVFEDNIFDQFRVMGGGQIIEFQQSGNDSIVLRGNEFRDILNINDNAATLRIEYHDNFFYVAENRFVNCTGGFARGIVMTNVNALVTANEFIGSSEFDPYVYARRSFNNDLRINLQGFAETGYALEGDGTWDIDARNCWWGDSTGPYHVTRNPNGHGARITGPVDFFPWLTDSTQLDTTEADTTEDDSTEGIHDPLTLLPSETRMDVFPNPFNSVATVYLFIAEPGVYRVELYNTLGQRVRDVWTGHAVGSHSLSLNADELPSGIYYVRLLRGDRDVAMTKVLLMK